MIPLFRPTAPDAPSNLLADSAEDPKNEAPSLVVAAEELVTRKIFTLDRNDFEAYRLKRGHRHYAFEIVS